MRDWFANKPLTRIQWIYIAAAWAFFMSSLSIYRAIADLTHPFPAWMTPRTTEWYEYIAQAIVQIIVAVACITYNIRHRHPDSRPSSKLWRDRPELRIILYSLAILLIMNLPSELFKTIRAVQTSPWNDTFWSLFPIADSLLYPAIGIALILYDRRRLRRDRAASNQCLHCGYDLRATPDRCPECGAVPSGRCGSLSN